MTEENIKAHVYHCDNEEGKKAVDIIRDAGIPHEEIKEAGYTMPILEFGGDTWEGFFWFQDKDLIQELQDRTVPPPTNARG